MRSYTNLNGEIVEVSEEHLETASKIKRELQMTSPSHRCNWNLHKQFMEKEGFFDSEASENYRLMIKNYQSSVGELDSKEKHADLVADSKLASIQEAVGEMYFTKREVQLESQKLGKLKRELTLYGVIAQEIRKAMLNDLEQVIPQWSYENIVSPTPKRMVVLVSDLHVGAVVVNVLGNSYDFTIAKKRMKKYINEIIRIAQSEGVNQIDIVSLGDLTENVHMRKSQGFDTEFNYSQQIVKAYQLLRDFIVNLSQFFLVTYQGISGNHDRIAGNKDDNLDGDSSVVVINEMIKEFIVNANATRIKYNEADNINYSTWLEINGAKLKFVHGDNEKGNKKLAIHSDQDNEHYNVLVMGHLHHYDVKEVGINKYELHVGSLEGANNYGRKGKFTSSASQGLIIIGENGEIDIRRIDLQIT